MPRDLFPSSTQQPCAGAVVKLHYNLTAFSAVGRGVRHDVCSIAQHDTEKASLGFLQVTVAITDIGEGSHERFFELKDPKDASRTMATLKVP